MNFSMWGKTEQIKTTGVQLLNPDLYDPNYTYNGVTATKLDDGSVRYTGTIIDPSTGLLPTFYLGDCVHLLERGKRYTASFYYNGYKNNGGIQYVQNDEMKYSASVIFDKDITSFKPYVQGKVMDYKDGAVIYPMLNEGTESKPFEPYSGGIPSPSQGWEQPIEVTDQPVTINVKNGTDQQSVALVPPRPLTKWDKLEKVDGVWRWMYQSRWIESYVDENITGEYISTTGGLNAGAKVCYKSAPEYIPLPQPVQDKLNVLTMYAGTTEITNDGGCNMELTYTVDTQSYVDTKIAEVSKAII